MNDMPNDENRLAAGDKVVRLTQRGFGHQRLSVFSETVVERLTPTGIAVLSNGTRLSPEPRLWDEDHFWEPRGTASTWSVPHRYFRAESETVAKARHSDRVSATEAVIDSAYEKVKEDRYSLASLDALNEAVSARLAFHVRGEKS